MNRETKRPFGIVVKPKKRYIVMLRTEIEADSETHAEELLLDDLERKQPIYDLKTRVLRIIR